MYYFANVMHEGQKITIILCLLKLEWGEGVRRERRERREEDREKRETIRFTKD